MGVFLFDPRQKALRKIGNAFLEILYSMLKGFDIRCCIVEKDIEYVVEAFRLCQVDFKNRFVILIEDSATCILKDGVCNWIACIDLFSYLGDKVIFGIFGFPVTTREIEAIT